MAGKTTIYKAKESEVDKLYTSNSNLRRSAAIQEMRKPYSIKKTIKKLPKTLIRALFSK